jgi:hypothetical protein
MNRRSVIVGAGGALLAAGMAGAAWQSSVGRMADYDAAAARLRAGPVGPDLRAVIRNASLAANSHNTQPWQFEIGDRAIEIRPDFSRRMDYSLQLAAVPCCRRSWGTLPSTGL